MKYVDYNMLFAKTGMGISANIPMEYDSDEYIITGCGILEFDESDLRDEVIIKIQEKNKIRFFSDDFKPVINNIYCVPYMKLFALDENGFYAIKIDFFCGNEFCTGKVYYLENHKKAFYICENIYKFFNEFENDKFDNNLILDNEIKLFSSYSQAIEVLNDFIF